MLTEKQVKECGDQFTIKCYLILKKIHGKEYALIETEESPVFKNKTAIVHKTPKATMDMTNDSPSMETLLWMPWIWRN